MFYSCRADQQGNHFISGITDSGTRQFDIALPGRGHGMQRHPQQSRLIVFSRRPGTFMWVIDLESRQVSHKVTSPEGRHFYGHGAFSADGRYLFVTENEFDTARGVIAIYDTTDNYRRIGELDSYGIGPHELVHLRQGEILAVANGGIQTHPDFHRTKLNLDTMDPSLAYIDTATGKLMDAWRPPQAQHQLSIRHLAATVDDQVCIAMQYQGAANIHPSLIATHQGEEQLQFVSLPATLNNSLRNYCGSVCTDISHAWFAISAPRGNRIVFISTRDKQTVHTVEMQDGCGIAMGNKPGEFIISSGNGSLLRYQVNDNKSLVIKKPDQLVKWDNHLLAG